jgi:hypothetical protein
MPSVSVELATPVQGLAITIEHCPCEVIATVPDVEKSYPHGITSKVTGILAEPEVFVPHSWNRGLVLALLGAPDPSADWYWSDVDQEAEA